MAYARPMAHAGPPAPHHGHAFDGVIAWAITWGLLLLCSGPWPDDELAALGGFLLAFALLAVVVLLATVGAARAEVSTRWIALAAPPAVALVGVGVALELPEPSASLLVGAVTLTLSAWIGARLGREVTTARHLWPLALVAMGADAWSVLQPTGLTRQLVEGEAAGVGLGQLLLLAVPVPGVGVAPLLGVGDVVFCALLAGAVEHLGLGRWRLTCGLAVGFALTLASLLVAERPVPALLCLAPAGVAALGGRARPRAAEVALAFAVVGFVAGALSWARAG